ncbi:putative serine protease K12H4.7 [Drosophila sulfurigaster albostrigata]|uniref:putative serine protease K12H4.7 n=1 Tax=Drosophila sulfurigaster albostrigata TaxID=89887 RepID=UPI002D21A79C|nr:putative serine protease K12H4.7 [Drosophila sulfurigaster albostrigata]
MQNGKWCQKIIFFGMYFELVEIFNAYAFETEHRYYGRSWPVQNMTVENLQYLTTRQVLADLAHFIRQQKATIPEIANSKVIIIGCSYAANLVTYFRKDYPDLIDGGWAAGAGLAYRLDYSDGYVSAGKSLRKFGGDACYDRVEHFSKTYLNHKRQKSDTYKMLKLLNLTEYYEDMRSIILVHAQHRNATGMQKLCKNITSVDPKNINEFGRLLKLFLSQTVIDHSDKVKEINFNPKYAARQNFYQTCSEFGDIFTTSSRHQPFGDTHPFGKEVAKCKEIFGPKFTIDYISSKVDEITAKYGAQHPNVDHIYFTKAEDDPWRWAGITDECATIIPGIGHCKELRARAPTDWPTTSAAQQKAIDLIRDWINGNGTTRETLIKC